MACLLFPNEEKIMQALKEKRQLMLGTTHTVLFKHRQFAYFENFETKPEVHDREMLSDFVSEEKVSRTVQIFALPSEYNVAKVQEMFKPFNVKASDIKFQKIRGTNKVVRQAAIVTL